MYSQTLALMVLALAPVAAQAQGAPQSDVTNKVPTESCILMDEDYTVYTALLAGLGGPEDPEESWRGKEFVLVDLTAMTDTDATRGGWGFRSQSKDRPRNRLSPTSP